MFNSKAIHSPFQTQQLSKILDNNEKLMISHNKYLEFRLKHVAHLDITDLHESKFVIFLNPDLSDKKIIGLGVFNFSLVAQPFEFLEDMLTI